MPIGIVSDSDFDSELRSLRSGVVPEKESHTPAPVERPIIVDIIEPDIVAPLDESHELTPFAESHEANPSRGRALGDTNVPESLRRIIGETQITEGRQAALELASEFGISASSASAYARGANSTTTYNSPKLENVRHLNGARQRIVKKATRRLQGALSALTQEKLDMTDARDLSAIAKDMAVVIKQMEPQVEPESGNKPQFVVFAPTFRQENTYETIQVVE